MTRFAGQALATPKHSVAAFFPAAVKRGLSVEDYAAAVAATDQKIPEALRQTARQIGSKAQVFDLLDAMP